MANPETILADCETVIRALDTGEVIGVAALLQRAAPAADLATRVRLAGAVCEQILSGTVASQPCGRSVRLTLTRQGRRAARALRPGWRHKYSLLCLAMGAAALASNGCSSTRPELARGPLMGFPTPTGVQQVRDAAGRTIYEHCNPCAGPTVKTPILGSYQFQEKARPMPAPEVITMGALRVPTLKQPILAMPPAASIQQPQTTAAPLRASTSPAVVMLFAFSSSRLTPEVKAAIRDFAARAKTARAVYVRGSTDSQGSAVANEVLAKNRATVIRAELIAQGVPRKKIKTSYCTTCFRSDNDTKAGRQANRRVDIGIDQPTK